MPKDYFQFGIEAEFMLVNKDSYQPLWHRDLTFESLNKALESATTSQNISLEGLELESPHTLLMPFAVEGYSLVDQDFKPIQLLPKGVEIRTPIHPSIEACLDSLVSLHDSLQNELKKQGYLASSLSHHPIETHFQGPPNKKRYDYWQWSMEVMTTYGPDFNISLPEDIARTLNYKELDEKVNYYAPSMVAFSLASPFVEGQPWKIRGALGKSFRTYRRSTVAPMIELHPEENGRMEFKGFDMPWHLEDFHAYFLLWLTLLLDESLPGRASKSSRIFDLGQVARLGWEAETAQERASEVLDSAFATLPKWGFNTHPLLRLRERLLHKTTPADLLIQDYFIYGSLPETLRKLTCLYGAA
ncbi:MAG: hypothetical protein ACKOA8_13285 [Deltaproteobacteria bacterium]